MTKRELDRDIARMRVLLAKFNRMGNTDRWYVLTRIAQKDDPGTFRRVAQENRVQP